MAYDFVGAVAQIRPGSNKRGSKRRIRLHI